MSQTFRRPLLAQEMYYGSFDEVIGVTSCCFMDRYTVSMKDKPEKMNCVFSDRFNGWGEQCRSGDLWCHVGLFVSDKYRLEVLFEGHRLQIITIVDAAVTTGHGITNRSQIKQT